MSPETRFLFGQGMAAVIYTPFAWHQEFFLELAHYSVVALFFYVARDLWIAWRAREAA